MYHDDFMTPQDMGSPSDETSEPTNLEDYELKLSSHIEQLSRAFSSISEPEPIKRKQVMTRQQRYVAVEKQLRNIASFTSTFGGKTFDNFVNRLKLVEQFVRHAISHRTFEVFI